MNRNSQSQLDTSELPYRLGDLLVRRELITPGQLKQALQQQASSGQKLGQILVDLNFITPKTLTQALRKQRWLRPCAACFAFIAPFSATYANEHSDHDVYHSWSQSSSWDASSHQHIGQAASSVDLMKVAAETAWDIYQGEPEKGEWRYSLSKTQENNGYNIEMTVHF